MKLLVAALVGCGDPSDAKPDGASDTGTDTDTGCAAEEVVANGVDDDCDGWADEFGDGFRTFGDGERALVGTDGLALGRAMDVARDSRGAVWLVAGGISLQDEQGAMYGAVMALSQPGAELHHIQSQDDFDAFGVGVVAGAFEDTDVVLFAVDESGVHGYTGEETSSTQWVTETPPGGGLNSAADVDQDGFDELFVTELTDEVQLSLVILDGPVTAPLWDRERGRIQVDFSGAGNHPWNFGLRPGVIADLTGDGAPEMALPTSDEPGRQWIVPADLQGSVWLEDASFASLRGETVENTSTSAPAAGDANGDGYVDLLTGGALIGGRAGKAYLSFGPFDGDRQLADAEAAFPGDFPNDWCGWSLTFVPDLDGDGADEPVIACPHDPYLGVPGPGRVELFLGAHARGALGLADAAAVWVEPGVAEAGWNLEGAFDLTDDGIPDLAIAVPYDATVPEVGHAHGAVYVIPGPLL